MSIGSAGGDHGIYGRQQLGMLSGFVETVVSVPWWSSDRKSEWALWIGKTMCSPGILFLQPPKLACSNDGY